MGFVLALLESTVLERPVNCSVGEDMNSKKWFLMITLHLFYLEV